MTDQHQHTLILKVLVSVFDIRFFVPLPQNIIQNQTESANELFIPKSAQIKTESTKKKFTNVSWHQGLT